MGSGLCGGRQMCCEPEAGGLLSGFFISRVKYRSRTLPAHRPPRPAPGPQSVSLSRFGQPEFVGALGSELGSRLACRGCGDPTGLPTDARELRVAEAPDVRLRIVLTSHRKGRPGGSAEAALLGVLHAAETHGDSRLRGQSRTPCELAPCRGQPSPSQLLSPREEGRLWSVQVPERGIVKEAPGHPPPPPRPTRPSLPWA